MHHCFITVAILKFNMIWKTIEKCSEQNKVIRSSIHVYYKKYYKLKTKKKRKDCRQTTLCENLYCLVTEFMVNVHVHVHSACINWYDFMILCWFTKRFFISWSNLQLTSEAQQALSCLKRHHPSAAQSLDRSPLSAKRAKTNLKG